MYQRRHMVGQQPTKRTAAHISSVDVKWLHTHNIPTSTVYPKEKSVSLTLAKLNPWNARTLNGVHKGISTKLKNRSYEVARNISETVHKLPQFNVFFSYSVF